MTALVNARDNVEVELCNEEVETAYKLAQHTITTQLKRGQFVY